MFFNRLGLVNSYWAFYLPAISYAFGTFFAKQYMDTLPDTLREAAIIDGAGEFRAFFKIFLPLCGTLVATLTILQFLANWNNLLWPLVVLNDQNKYTIQIGLAMFKSSVGEVGVSGNPFPAITMAGTVISLIPVLLVYLFLQRYIIQSIALSGIKQ
jgi:multiple sugar transport system permease protein